MKLHRRKDYSGLKGFTVVEKWMVVGDSGLLQTEQDTLITIRYDLLTLT